MAIGTGWEGSRPRGKRAAAWWAVLALGLGTWAGCRTGATRGSILYADALESLALGDSAQALEQLSTAAYESPEDERIRYLVGQLFAKQGTIESRARGEKELRLATQLAPERGLYKAALGELLHVQGFQHESMSALRQAVRLDPSLGRAWYVLGLEMLEVYREDPTSDADGDSTLGCFERALGADSTNGDARWKLAYLLFRRGERERAHAVAQGGIRSQACPGPWGILLAALEYQNQRPAAAAAMLGLALDCMSPAARDSLLSPRLLVHQDSTFCDGCKPARRDSAITAFWWGVDPTPATLLNERLLEHVVRVVDADFWFEVPRLRLAGRNTDRGEIYLRYGPPDLSWKDIDLNTRTWFWEYAKQVPTAQTFLFHDTYANHTYVRQRRSAGSDLMYKELLDMTGERSLVDLGPKPKGFRHIVRRFRGADGRTAVELAFGFFETLPAADSVRVELAAWEGPGRRAARRSATVPAHDLYRVDPYQRVGRMRLEVPSQWLELGVQITATSSDSLHRTHDVPLWTMQARDTLDLVEYDGQTLGMSDLLPAHRLEKSSGGGPFDIGRITAVPRVDSEIAGDRLHLYFEIYPGDEALHAKRSLYVTYRVQAQPPRTWRFRDQFSAAARARRERRTAVESTFMLEPHRRVEDQELSIDLSNLEPGDYELTVEVQPRGETERVSSVLQFSVPEERQGKHRGTHAAGFETDEP